MRRSNCAGALQYVPEVTWILFLRILDEREEIEADEARAVGAEYKPSLTAPYRWRDWAAPDGAKRAELQSGALGAFFHFLHEELLPHLRELGEQPQASSRQKVISQIIELGGAHAHRHRAQLPRRHRQGRRDRPHRRRHHPRLHALAGLRRPAAQDGREGQRRRPVLHAARDHPRHGARRRPAHRRDDLRPGLRHRRLPRSVLRADDRRGQRQHHLGRPARHTAGAHLLRPRKGQRRLPHRARQPGVARHRRAAHLARQHADRHRRLRRPLRRRAAALRRGPHEPAVRRQGRQGRADALRLQDRRHAGALLCST